MKTLGSGLESAYLEEEEFENLRPLSNQSSGRWADVEWVELVADVFEGLYVTREDIKEYQENTATYDTNTPSASRKPDAEKAEEEHWVQERWVEMRLREAFASESSDSESSTSSDGEDFDDGTSSTTGPKKLPFISRTSDPSDGDDLDRADWKVLGAFRKILAHHVSGAIDSAEIEYEFVQECSGSFNYVRIYTVLTNASVGKYVIKVPAVCTAGRWQAKNAYMLRSELGTLKLIHERTKCPVPDVIAYDDTLANDLGAPYILMRALIGVPATDVWFEDGAYWDMERAEDPPESIIDYRLSTNEGAFSIHSLARWLSCEPLSSTRLKS